MAKAEYSENPEPNQIGPDSESDSDPDDHLPSVDAGVGFGSLRRTQVIHSGHFMVSSPHSDSIRRRSVALYRDNRYNIDSFNKPGCQTYRFGPLSSRCLSIDPTLTRLFECMTLAYSGKIVSPKWKSFKGLRLLWRDKIRLNNGIWRAWFIQYVEKRKNPVCGFVTPLEGSEADAHRKPEAIVLEGSYWKRRIEVVIKEYHKWRIYYKKRLQKNKDLLSMLQKGPICRAGLEKWTNQIYPEPEATSEEVHMFDLDCFLSDISDTLFTMTQKPTSWSGDRQNTYTSNADMIQPGLTPLQPNLDDLMDIPDIFMSYRAQPTELPGYSDCGFFESSSSGTFALNPEGTSPLTSTSPVLTRPTLSSETLPEPSSSVRLPGHSYPRQTVNPNMTFNPSGDTPEPKFTGHSEYVSEFHPSLNLPSGITPYGPHMSFGGHGMPTTEMPGAVTQESPYQYQPACLRHRHVSTQSRTSAAVTSTVITHTGSAMTALPSDGYSGTEEMFAPVGYQPTAVSPSLSSHGLSHCFSVPQQVGVATGRGKYKQKSGEIQSVARSTAPPTQTSCLANLLSSGSHERKPSLSFDAHSGLSASSISPPTSSGQVASHISHNSSWASTRTPAMTSLHCQTTMSGHAHSSTISSLLTQQTPLLTPKTEKLSPVQMPPTERSSLTVIFSGNIGRTSPTNPPEKTPESHFLPGHAHVESTRTDTRRITHISAEQKRRFNIKLGFDTLHSLVTTLSSQPSIKISKATTLQKTAEYISKMQQERAQLHEEAQRLRDEILALNSAINVYQQQLPATGVPITRQRFDLMREKFREYVRIRTLQDWKFWIFSIIIEPLFESYKGMVSTASVEDLCRTTLSWLDQHCSLPALRPAVLSSLRLLCTSTSILADPSLLPEQAVKAVTHGHSSHSFS
ncbi:carbohydrate-responsive element-binding protein-like isoform X1 [Triplophysa rosa]|uniref:Carbohydrate-responsive element-binding protein n=1 Tax=Triplophysa rosa TaxID=992332 RepID=A0A9W7X3B0_TRIRA|nr:carbohydrate-responsive element-binding protein-like isoform X1 [Triplophysa rosa]KAI7813171.1 putative carbohydrate-responsive element-binding protein [Triplophysa rosa]